MAEGRGNFWTTLPGILTGAASVITAVVTFGTFLTNSCADRRTIAQLPQQPLTAQPSMVRTDADPAQSVVGDWVWSTGGFTSIKSDGTLEWNQHQHGPGLRVTGTWTCIDSSARQFLFRWHHGFSDVLTLAANGRTISGANQQTGTPISGSRL